MALLSTFALVLLILAVFGLLWRGAREAERAGRVLRFRALVLEQTCRDPWALHQAELMRRAASTFDGLPWDHRATAELGAAARESARRDRAWTLDPELETTR